MNLSEAEHLYREDETDPDRFRIYFTELARQTTPTDVCLMVDEWVEKHDWKTFNRETIIDIAQGLIGLGIGPGVWLTARRRKDVHHIPSGDIAYVIHVLNRRHQEYWSEPVFTLPSKVNGEDVSGTFAYSRKSNWEDNRKALIESMKLSQANDIAPISTFSRELKPNKLYQVFIPVSTLNKLYAIHTTWTSAGFSRSNIWSEAQTGINWSTPNQVKKLQRLLFSDLAEVHNCSKLKRNCLVSLTDIYRFDFLERL